MQKAGLYDPNESAINPVVSEERENVDKSFI